jgi:hypothetical protein
MAISIEQLTAAAKPGAEDIHFQLAPDVSKRAAELASIVKKASISERYRRHESFQEHARRFTEAVKGRGSHPMPSEAHAKELAAQTDALATNLTQRRYLLGYLADHYPLVVQQVASPSHESLKPTTSEATPATAAA